MPLHCSFLTFFSVKKITFDGANSADEEDAADNVVMYVKSGASNVTFEECIFENATHVTLGTAGVDANSILTIN